MIRKSFSILFLWLWAVGLVAQTDGYDPVNPPNPEARLLRTLSTAVQPVKAGYTNAPGGRYRMGEEVYVYTYANEFYRFKCWTDGEDVVSTESSFYYVMPDRDVQLTAVYEYDPASPVQPNVQTVLTLKASPQRGGYFNYSNNQKFNVGTVVNLWAYEQSNYKFKHWEYKGEVVSTDYEYRFTIPEGLCEVVAVFEYNPTSPKNPGANSWIPEAGELIMDDFQEYGLADAIYQMTDWNPQGIQSLIVNGRIESYDIGNMNQFQIADMDFSRTSGATVVPSWSFECNETLTTISLPGSIEYIEWYAFYECHNLTTVNCYATVPPYMDDGVFAGIDKDQLVIYVPAESVDLYQNADGWRDFTILPLQTQVVALELDLPAGSEDGRFKNMFIELVNANSGQRIRYVITDRVAYTFQNLMRNTTWNAYVKNAADQVLGKIEGIELKDQDAVRSFENLLEPQAVTATVVTPEGLDVTDQVQLMWLDASGSYLGQGNRITGILPIEGAAVTLRVTLPQSLAMVYQMPENVVYGVQPSDNVVTCELVPLPAARLTGTVSDIVTGLPLSGASVTVSQTLNGRYGKSFTVKTDAAGVYSVDGFDAPTTVTAVAPDYVSQTASYESLTVEDGVATLNPLALKSIMGAKISVAFTYTQSALPGTQGETQPFFGDYQNVAYTIRDVTTGKDISEFNVQYPQIVLLEDVALGDELLLTATSKTDAFQPVQAGGRISELNTMSVTFDIKQLGQISATYVSSENASVNGILYDDKGKFVQSSLYSDASLLFTDLADGRYTLVSMGSSKLFNTIYDLYKFSQAGLVKGTDYVTAAVTVQSGVISTVKVPFVPFFDESKLYYTGSNTSFAVNKAQVTAGSYLTLSARIDFKDFYADEVSDLRLVVDLPDACSLVDNSVMVGNALGDYVFDNHRVTIPFSEAGERIRFCIIPTAGGNYAPSAYAQFKYNGQTVTQPIGQAAFTVKDLSINVPSVVAKPVIPVNGTAVGKSKVQIYDGGTLIGETTSLSNGVWATTCELVDPENQSEHPIYAKVTTQTGLEMLSETQIVKYDASAIQMDNVTMYYTNPEVNGWRGQNYVLVYDFQNPSTTAYRYVYYIYNRTFTFTIELSTNDPEKVTKVILKVKTGDGKWHALPATFDKKLMKWFVSALFGDMYDGIVPVNVAVDFYVLIDGEEVLVSCPTSGYPDNDVPIDPSGYVYEGVPTNRLEGVTASCYYKETVEDAYGDKSEVVRLWDAAEYAQENPLFTDEDGFYRWDVPQGLWQVKFEKEGYETTYSDWLPVPPPQLDVNIAMTQAAAPQVQGHKAYEDGVEIEFDKYMLPESLTTGNIYVTADGVKVDGTIEFLNSESTDEDNADGPKLASRVKFVLPEGETWMFDDELTLFVSTGVKSYAGIALQENYEHSLDVEKQVRKIAADSLLTVLYEGTRTLQVSGLPSDAAKGKKLRIRTLSTLIAEINAEGLEAQEDGSALIQLDADGQAVITVSGGLPGSTTLQFSIDDTGAESKTTVKVEQAPSLVTNHPRASRASGSEVYRGTLINLLSDDSDAKIWYTLDGSNPTTASTPYSRPIAITDATTIKAIALKEGYEESEVETFEYTIKQNSQDLQLEGWSWISHNMNRSLGVDEFPTTMMEVKSQTKGVIRDEKLGLFGNLKDLNPMEAYKVKVSESVKMSVSGDAYNAATGVMHLAEGWNWIGYPVDQTMSVNEALANLTPSEGDILVGLSGSAEFIEGSWIGDLEVMTPGQGYMIKVGSDIDLLYNTAIVSKAGALVRGRLKTNRTSWSVDEHQYPDVMPMRAQLFREETPTEADEFTVAAFCGTECRGIGKYVNGVIFMNVHGEGLENITFLASDNATEDIVEINENIPFQTDIVGSYQQPYALHLGNEAVGVKEHNSQLGVWPTVATTQVTVSLGGQPIDRLTITSADGRMQRLQTSGASSQVVNVSSLPAGVYVIAVQSGNECFYRKIMKVNQ